MNPPSTSIRELLHAKLDVLLAEFDTVAENAAYGETLNDLDAFLLLEGRALLKEILQQKHQERIAKKEQTQEAAQCPS